MATKAHSTTATGRSIPMGKHVAYNRETKDFDCYYDGQYLGSRATMQDAEAHVDGYVYDLLAKAPTPAASPSPSPDVSATFAAREYICRGCGGRGVVSTMADGETWVTCLCGANAPLGAEKPVFYRVRRTLRRQLLGELIDTANQLLEAPEYTAEHRVRTQTLLVIIQALHDRNLGLIQTIMAAANA